MTRTSVGEFARNHKKAELVGGGVAIGLASLALAAHELHKRRVQPDSLRDPRLITFRDGAFLKVAAVLLGGEEIMARDDIKARSGLSRHQLSGGLNFMEEHGLAASAMFETEAGRQSKHYMLSDEILRAVAEDPDAYTTVIGQAEQFYPAFSVDSLWQRLSPTESE